MGKEELGAEERFKSGLLEEAGFATALPGASGRLNDGESVP